MSSSAFDSPLFVRDRRRRYQPATADQILEAARSVVDQRMHRGTAFTDPSVAGHFRSEEHTSELQSLMRISYAVFCLKNKTTQYSTPHINYKTNIYLNLNSTSKH